MSDNSVPQFDKSNFTNVSYVKYIDKPWGYELHLTPEDKPYMLKIEHINAGKRYSLQIHDDKIETYTLMSGRAAVIWENASGELVETELEPAKGYTTQLGQRHRLVGITDADVVEASTPERGTTWRLEDDFGRPHETPEQRKLERGE
jgi:mannose-6-phosphate isomerase